MCRARSVWRLKMNKASDAWARNDENEERKVTR